MPDPTVPSQPAARFRAVREQTRTLCTPLVTEDFVIQSMEDASPTKWHLAHTTWFFEVFVLVPFQAGYRLKDERYPYLFNSYYVQAGDRWSRPMRGILSRPTVQDIWDYRAHVDEAMDRFLQDPLSDEARRVLEIGLHHEQQHQELMMTDIKHVFSVNPLRPVYQEMAGEPSSRPPEAGMVPFDATIVPIGHRGDGFHYDNEGPPHRQFVEAFSLASRPVTNGEYLSFVEEGGYETAGPWLSQGWDRVQSEGWGRPMYWLRTDDGWMEFTLQGLRPLREDAPLTHVSYFEADAFARWAGMRLPTEFEWEHAASAEPVSGHFADRLDFHPGWTHGQGRFSELFGGSWEWTSSHYSPYPGYRPVEGALGEYNGKFMANQFVLRGGSCAPPADHIRSTYRNFFPSHARWQFAGVRLAQTL
ncbi:MAG: ergothioneine biosynthesis protein EgtB [Bacteroidetes bacterium]|nr:ergothioneine biosynthesis protein EgtB [Bacteroidota bacterium]